MICDRGTERATVAHNLHLPAPPSWRELERATWGGHMKVFGTVCRRLAVALAASLLLCGLAQGTVIFSGSLSVSAGDPTQLGRLSRNGVPQDWSGGEPFPGVINPATSYHYVTLDLDLGALEAGHVFSGFIQIIFDSVFTTTFLSAYLNSYNPADLSEHWLGDPGTSGNYFGVDPLFFQVVAGQHRSPDPRAQRDDAGRRPGPSRHRDDRGVLRHGIHRPGARDARTKHARIAGVRPGAVDGHPSILPPRYALDPVVMARPRPMEPGPIDGPGPRSLR